MRTIILVFVAYFLGSIAVVNAGCEGLTCDESSSDGLKIADNVFSMDLASENSVHSRALTQQSPSTGGNEFDNLPLNGGGGTVIPTQSYGTSPKPGGGAFSSSQGSIWIVLTAAATAVAALSF